MRYSLTAATFSAMVAVATAAGPIFTNTNFNIREGQPFEIMYDGCETGCKIELVNGESSNLKSVEVIASAASGTSTTITIDGLPTDTYAFRITDGEGNTNYSAQFKLTGTGAPPANSESQTKSASSATSAASSAASSASSTGSASGTSSGSSKATSTGSQTASMTGSSSGTSTGTSTGSSTGSKSTTLASVTKSAASSGTTAAPTGTSSTTAFVRSSSTSTAGNSITTAVPGSGSKFASPMGLVAGAAVAVAALL